MTGETSYWKPPQNDAFTFKNLRVPKVNMKENAFVASRTMGNGKATTEKYIRAPCSS